MPHSELYSRKSRRRERGGGKEREEKEVKRGGKEEEKKRRKNSEILALENLNIFFLKMHMWFKRTASFY